MIPLPQKAQYILDTLLNNGFQAYAVGGSVRDIIMGKPTSGWDYTTDAIPEEILKIFPDSFYDNQFGTVGVKIRSQKATMPAGRQEDREQNEEIDDIYEITTYRSEEGYSDRRHPDKIAWGKTLDGDLGRRDFTINAIAYDGTTFFDPYNGMSDIEKKVIRAVGNPEERFSEDALRMMRAIRIASELGFTIDGETFQAIKTSAKLIMEISAERVRDELLKLIKSPYASDGILLLKNTDILSFILPELDASFATPQKSPKRHHLYDVGMHCVMSLKYCPSPDPIIRLATLLHDIGKPSTFNQDSEGVITFYNHELVGTKIAKNICMRLRLSKKDADKILTLIRWHQFSVDERQTDSAIRRFIRHVGKENLDDSLALRIGDRLGGGARETSWRLELFKKRLDEVQKQPFSVKDLKVNGFDVMKIFDCKPGPIIGKTLETLFQEVDEGKLANDRELLLSKLEEIKLSTKQN
jgi:putative nucleotidyltransferase with HDIG domain